jgi:hypothetical protein
MTNITLYGMWTAVGKTVSVFLGGLDCGDYVVASDGSVVVPYGSDPDGLLTAAYLASISSAIGYGALAVQIDVTIANILQRVVVPCVIGYNYTSEGETMRPLMDDQAKTPQGPALAKIQRANMFGALLQGAIGGANGLQFRSGSSTTWFPAQLRTAAETPLNYATLFNGVHWDVIDGDSNFDGVISWKMARPYPVTVCGVSGFIETVER